VNEKKRATLEAWKRLLKADDEKRKKKRRKK